jgi:hypothetical protein
MSPEMFLVALLVAGFLCVGLTMASVGWRSDVDNRIEGLEARCRRLEAKEKR